MAIRGLLVDIDGVLTVSWQPVPGAVAAVEALRSSSVPMAFVTNTTSRSRADMAAALRQAGFAIDGQQILTAEGMTAAYLRTHHPGARCWALGQGDVAADLEGVHLAGPDEQPDVVVLGGAGPVFGYEAVNRIFQLATAGVPLVAMHRNLSWSTDDGLQLDTGAFLGAIERAADVEAAVMGKPSPACFAAGLELLGLPADEVAMVGDDLESDVLGAQAVGITGVLVRTGKYRPGHELARRGDCRSCRRLRGRRSGPRRALNPSPHRLPGGRRRSGGASATLHQRRGVRPPTRAGGEARQL